MTSIQGHGGYVPLKRIERPRIDEQVSGMTSTSASSGESSVPNRDENHITMACEAANIALQRAGMNGDDIDAVFAASVTDPFASHGIAAHVGYRCGIEGDIRTADFRGTTRAATDAFLTARSLVDADAAAILVVATDIMPVEIGHEEESTSGACAGALVLNDGGESTVAELEGFGQETNGFVERHRTHGDAAVIGDRRFEVEHGMTPALREAASEAMREVSGMPEIAVVNTPHNRAAESLVDELSEETSYETTFDSVGFAGPGSFLLDLVHALETASTGDRVFAANYGCGGGDVLCFTVGSRTDEHDTMAVSSQIASKEEIAYAKHLEYRDVLDKGGS